ncbi:transmembrane protein 199-like [Diadema setosum]|uniref:transmembrane protein 199-like n=1 Tax=Diadema setosum TaxID=31175 RepID=UPI003B3BB19C
MSGLVILTERIRRSVETILTRDDVSEVTKREFRELLEAEDQKKDDKPRSIPFTCVRKVHELLSAGSSGIYLHELLEGAEIYHPPLEPPKRNPELVARLERLKAEQEDKQYREMTKNVNVQTYGKSPLSQIGKDVRSFQAQMVGVVNMVLTIVGAFVFGYMAAWYRSQPVITCVSTGLALALVVAVADVYFFIKFEV